ncbi:MAG: hypothetical protein AB7W47_17285 [Calditrichaceae bacterium]
MKLLLIRRIRFLFILFYLIITMTVAGCSSAKNNDNIAQINDFGITIAEFQDRLNYNPYLRAIEDVNVVKKIVLSSLIAEKILSLENEETSGVSENVNLLIRQHLREAMIEQFRRDSVESAIKISDAELQHEYQKAIREIDIHYIAFDSLNDALKVKSKIDSGRTYESVVKAYMKNRGWGDEPIPYKKIRWANEDYDLEEKIYQLKPNEISNIIKAHGEYYLIKIDNIKIIEKLSSKDYKNRLPALEDRILRNKIKKQYRVVYHRTIQKEAGEVEWDKLKEAAKLVSDEIEFSQNDPAQTGPVAYKPLPENIYLNRQAILNDLKNNTAVNFPDGSTWTFQELMVQLKYGPYAFDFSNSGSFIHSFIQNVRLLMEHEAIYKLAQKKGYEHNKLVQDEYKMWKSYYQANSFRHNLLSELDAKLAEKNMHGKDQSIEEQRLEYFDARLTAYAENYKIVIYKAVYDTVSLNKLDMVVRKSHFANRLVSPRLEPLIGLPFWQKKIDSLFRRYEIN